jgi:hypothetical protein
MRCALQPLTPFEEPSSLLDALASEQIGRMNRSIDCRSDTWARQTGRTSIEKRCDFRIPPSSLSIAYTLA